MSDQEVYEELTQPAVNPPVAKPRAKPRTPVSVEGTSNDDSVVDSIPALPSREGRRPLGPDGRISKMKVRRKGQKLGEKPSRPAPPAPADEEEKLQDTLDVSIGSQNESAEDIEQNMEEQEETQGEEEDTKMENEGEEQEAVVTEDKETEMAAEAEQQEMDASKPKGKDEDLKKDEDPKEDDAAVKPDGGKENSDAVMEKEMRDSTDISATAEEDEQKENEQGVDAMNEEEKEKAMDDEGDKVEKKEEINEEKPAPVEGVGDGSALANSQISMNDKPNTPEPYNNPTGPGLKKKKSWLNNIFQKKDAQGTEEAMNLIESILAGDQLAVGEATSSQTIPKRKAKLFLPIKQGEKLSILEMTKCPSGTWVCKNAAGHVGFVNTNEVSMDPMSMRGFLDVIPKRMDVPQTNKEGIPLVAKSNASAVQILSTEECQTKARELTQIMKRTTEASSTPTGEKEVEDEDKEMTSADNSVVMTEGDGDDKDMMKEKPGEMKEEPRENSLDEEDTTEKGAEDVEDADDVKGDEDGEDGEDVEDVEDGEDAGAEKVEITPFGYKDENGEEDALIDDAIDQFGESDYEAISDKSNDKVSTYAQMNISTINSYPNPDSLYEVVDDNSRAMAKRPSFENGDETYEDVTTINVPSHQQAVLAQQQVDMENDGLYVDMSVKN
eukprot:m.3911 g.3911  ORF g.3911 m.3911 type:complete len:667 (+) comp2146_c0_seq1:84-2084(+)